MHLETPAPRTIALDAGDSFRHAWHDKVRHDIFAVLAMALSLVMAAPAFSDGGATPTCLDDKGSPIDWWVILKGHYGWEYVYTDSNASGVFSDIRPNINDKEAGALSLTMRAIQGGAYNEQLAYFAYNDAPPKKRPSWALDIGASSSDTESVAHAKGLVAFDGKRTLWLLHSVPHFPQKRSSHGQYAGLPKSSLLYGQSFMCLSLNAKALDDIMTLLRVDRANVFSQKIPPRLGDLLPFPPNDLARRLQATGLKNADIAAPAVTTLVTEFSKAKVTAFAKPPTWGQDLYHHLIAPYFGVGFSVRTWMHSELNLPSVSAGQDCHDSYFLMAFTPTEQNTCTSRCDSGTELACTFQQNILQVDEILLDKTTPLIHEHDHSKWAVASNNSTRPLVCIGDINTQKSQRTRGGGAACLEHKGLWQGFRQMIVKERQP